MEKSVEEMLDAAEEAIASDDDDRGAVRSDLRDAADDFRREEDWSSRRERLF